MPKPISNPFTEFEFTEEEYYAATRFGPLTLHLIQTLLSRAAQQKLRLTYDPKNPEKFLQDDAYIQASIETYEHLLLLYSDTEAPSKESAQSKADVTNPQPKTAPSNSTSK